MRRYQLAVLAAFALVLAGAVVFELFIESSPEDDLRRTLAEQIAADLDANEYDDLPDGYAVCMATAMLHHSLDSVRAEAAELGGQAGTERLSDHWRERSLWLTPPRERELFTDTVECNGGVAAWIEDAYGIDESGPEPVAADPAFLDCLESSLTVSDMVDLFVPPESDSDAFDQEDLEAVENRCAT